MCEHNILRKFGSLIILWGGKCHTTSKGIYEAGEDLWFKAYQLDVQTFGLSDKSKTLYLQMINPKDSVVWQEKYQDGIANGIKGGIIIGENIGKY